jgi:protein tyrosine/serine phosphatase
MGAAVTCGQPVVAGIRPRYSDAQGWLCMRRIVVRSMAGIVATVLVLGALLGIQIWSGNIHAVVEGELYRSAQLDPEELGEIVKEERIASILNLRGPNPDSPWYQDEVREAARLGVTHLDFAMKASRELTDEQAMQLMQIMRDAPKPLLIHCRSGADRTGLAAALYIAGVKGGTEWQAERQMWLNYGHFSRIGAAVAMTRTFQRLEAHFGFNGS